MAVVSVYRPEPEFAQRLAAICAQVDQVWVVDDTGADRDEHADRLAALQSEVVSVLVQDSNQGLARSLNRGVQACVDAGADWIVTFDQDSVPAEDFVSVLLAGAARIRATGARAAALAPLVIGEGARPVRHEWAGGTCSLSVVQSGWMFHRDTLVQIGPFNEDYFIYNLEAEYVARMHAAGMHVALCDRAVMQHELGTPRTRKILGRTARSGGYSAARKYYMWRNAVAFVISYWRTETRYSAHLLWWTIKGLLISLIVDPGRLEDLTTARRSLRDAGRRRLGAYPYGAADGTTPAGRTTIRVAPAAASTLRDRTACPARSSPASPARTGSTSRNC